LPSGDLFRTLAGEPFRPGDLEGEPLVVNLWASWCPPCRREMPMMADVATETADARFVFVNQGEAASTIRQYLDAESLDPDHVVLDGLGEFARHYRMPGLPATLFIGADGTLQSVHMGEISREGLLAGIERIQPD
jgi:thiol-disulfide isomerase/thioredoxin